MKGGGGPMDWSGKKLKIKKKKRKGGLGARSYLNTLTDR